MLPLGCLLSLVGSQGVNSMVYQGVGSRQQGFIVGELLDHIAQVAEIVNQELDRLFTDHLIADHMEQVYNHVFQLGAFDVYSHFERTLDGNLFPSLAAIGVEERPEANHG